MKITSGDYKYRNIEIPKGVRPTTEKVREAIFSMIMEWIPGATVLDLFAGSGALGLEALSRGAEKCYFCESNRQHAKILLSNIENCKAEEYSVVKNMNFESVLLEIADVEKFDIVFLDPPYEKIEYYDEALKLLQENNLLNENALIVMEHLYDNKLLSNYGNFEKIKEKKYGTIGVDIFSINY